MFGLAADQLPQTANAWIDTAPVPDVVTTPEAVQPVGIPVVGVGDDT
jgi:hypothetical protein